MFGFPGAILDHELTLRRNDRYNAAASWKGAESLTPCNAKLKLTVSPLFKQVREVCFCTLKPQLFGDFYYLDLIITNITYIYHGKISKGMC